MVKIVVLGTGPDREEVTQRPGEIVTAVGVDGLEESKDDPDIHGEEVELASNEQEKNGSADNADTEESSLDGRGVLGSKTERSRVGVMHLVDSLVERAVVKTAVEPVVPGILQDEADGDLKSHLPDGREDGAVVHAEVGSNGMEEPDLRKLGGEVADEDDGGTVPLLLEGGHLLRLNLVAAEEWDLIHDHVGQAAAEVDNLVKDETHDTGSEDVVLHPKIPSLGNRHVSYRLHSNGSCGGGKMDRSRHTAHSFSR